MTLPIVRLDRERTFKIEVNSFISEAEVHLHCSFLEVEGEAVEDSFERFEMTGK